MDKSIQGYMSGWTKKMAESAVARYLLKFKTESYHDVRELYKGLAEQAMIKVESFK